MANFILNTVWFLLLGWILSAIMLIVGALLFCTVIGIPLSIICFKQVMPVAFPFGRKPPQSSPAIHITNVQKTDDGRKEGESGGE